MEFVELHGVQTQLYADGRLQHERLVLLPGDELYAESLEVIEYRAVERLYELLGIRLHGSLPTQVPSGTLVISQDNADEVVAVVDEIALEASGCQLTRVLGNEGKADIQVLATLAFLGLRLESNRMVGRIRVLLFKIEVCVHRSLQALSFDGGCGSRLGGL